MMKAMEQVPAQATGRGGSATGTPITIPVSWIALAGLSLAALLVIAFGAPLAGISNPWWYLSRSSAMVGYVLLWASMALGVSITNKLARAWPGGPTAFDLHQYLSWLGLAFMGVHVFSLLGDVYIGNTVAQWLIPFASTEYESLWVGLGQVAFYLLIPVMLSFYMRKRLGLRGGRTVHGLSYAIFGLGLAHGLFSGTDSATLWAAALYWFTGVSVLALTIHRLAVTAGHGRKKATLNSQP